MVGTTAGLDLEEMWWPAGERDRQLYWLSCCVFIGSLLHDFYCHVDSVEWCFV